MPFKIMFLTIKTLHLTQFLQALAHIYWPSVETGADSGVKIVLEQCPPGGDETLDNFSMNQRVFY